ncbi:hypothetical protein KI688_004183 [Linnemannia hyalina]|uniref:F-box domain-containing protein n=1 Tax=Linnemannia hyalina TaxID=64524 RepID=A0A9P7XPG4_9FUNG|nr:hypothetical protein KI688_004183 [Linnemannia hyalina]
MTMTTSPTDTFFALPELISILAPFLPPQSLIHLSQTSRTLHTICVPLLWASLDLKNPLLLTNFLRSPEAQQAFGNNIDSIHAIKWNPDFSWHYLNALWAYLNTIDSSKVRKEVSAAALTHQKDGIMQYPPRFSLVPLTTLEPPAALFPPLPPLLRLTRLEAHICFYAKDNTITPCIGYNHDEHLHQVLWLVRLNRDTLRYLELTELTLTNKGVIRDVARTLSQLHRLETLRLTTHSSTIFSRQMFETFFFSCPASLVRCHIANALHKAWMPADYLDPVRGQDWDYDQGPLVLRATPLLHLRHLRVPPMPRQDLTSVLTSLMQHCPYLEDLHLPFLNNIADGLNPVIESIAQHCPQLSSLTFRSGCHGERLMLILELLPPQGLKTLFCRHYYDLASARLIAAFSRHSASLCQIELTHCAGLGSIVIQSVLTSCRVLEVFRVHGLKAHIRTSLQFHHAIEHDWVCKDLRELTLPVYITPHGRDPQYLYIYNNHHPSKALWTEHDLRHWEELGRFYAQIGSLTRLEVLNLKAIGAYVEFTDFLSPFETCLPGLLALEDPSSATDGQIGHLSKLAGLTKLRELRGSFVWTNKEAAVRIGEREVDWFATHLPALRIATFVARVDEEEDKISSFTRSESDYRRIEGLCQLLESRRPELKIRFEGAVAEVIVSQEGWD